MFFTPLWLIQISHNVLKSDLKIAFLPIDFLDRFRYHNALKLDLKSVFSPIDFLDVHYSIMVDSYIT